LAPIGVKPTSERQTRPLTHLEPQQQKEAWQRAYQLIDAAKVVANLSQICDKTQIKESHIVALAGLEPGNRQLESARAERNIWPIGQNGKTGSIPEGKVKTFQLLSCFMFKIVHYPLNNGPHCVQDAPGTTIWHQVR
jgi:hypothetical protein